MRRRSPGFTLVEMIGVLTIISIVASFTLPPIIRKIRQTQAVGEDEKLKQVSEAIVASIQANGRIPNPGVPANNPAGWMALATNYTALSSNALLCVYPENPYTERRYYLDPTFANYLAGLTTPYTTPADGFPTNGFPTGAMRVLLVSSSRGIMNPPTAGDATLPGTAGVNLPANDQLALANWNKVFSNGVVTVPTLSVSFSSNWSGLGEFLHVQAIDLRPLFCRVELFDTAAPVTVAVSPSGSGYGAVPSPITTNGTTINFSTNSTGGVLVAAVFPAQRQVSSYPRTINTNIIWGQILDSSLVSPAPPPNPANLVVTIPAAPQYDLGLGPQNFSSQSTNFYVIKGTSLQLIAPGVSTTTQTISKDCSFEYYGQSWRQLY